MKPESRKYEVIGTIAVIIVANIIIFKIFSERLEKYVADYTYDQLTLNEHK